MLSTKPSQESKQQQADTGEPLVRVENLTVHFPIGRSGFWGREQRVVHAVDDISFDIHKGETLGLVGESGSGKSTTGRAVLLKIKPTSGRVFFRGQDVTSVGGEELRRLRRHMQLVFQDPYASLNPRMKVVQIVAEPLVAEHPAFALHLAAAVELVRSPVTLLPVCVQRATGSCRP